MTGDRPRRDSELSRHDVVIGAADTGGRDLDEHLTLAGSGVIDLDQGDDPRPPVDECLHRCRLLSVLLTAVPCAG
ncbi:MAG: hypothetical protein M5T61_14255 [Acidimicrobiia bacterium]|nr:hypothetical protein [Acidimicrobiia bacterium]